MRTRCGKWLRRFSKVARMLSSVAAEIRILRRTMNKADLLELIRNGEDSTLEFKRDDVQNYDLAKALVAFLNLEGGTILLGVEDDGRISGTSRERLDEWVAELCRVKIEPPVVPLLSWARDAEPGRDVFAIRVTRGPDKPYARVHGGHKTYYIRVSNTSREASREELERIVPSIWSFALRPEAGPRCQPRDSRPPPSARLPDPRSQRAGSRLRTILAVGRRYCEISS